MKVLRTTMYRGKKIEVREVQVELGGIQGGTYPDLQIYIDNQNMDDKVIYPSTVTAETFVEYAKQYIDSL